jgi:hypothetical protein
MGGIDAPEPKRSEEEIRASLIEIGRNATTPEPHSVWVVEDPHPLGLYCHANRSEVDNICYLMPVGHFDAYPIPRQRLENGHIVFYHWKEREAAIEDAVARLAMVGRRCRFCHGAAHPATGSQYTPTFLVCGTCIRPYQDVMNKVAKVGLGAYLENWTASKSKKRLKAKHPDAKGFYESAGLFLGQDNRKVPGIL